MFKDYNRYLKESLKVYLFVLIIIVIFKLIGFDYFGLDVDNLTMLKLNNLFIKYNLNYVCYFVGLYIQFYLYIGLVTHERKHYIYALIGTLLNIITQIILSYILKAPTFLYSPISISIMIVVPMFITKSWNITRQIKILVLITTYQLISMMIRNVNIKYSDWNFIVDTLLNIDQLLLMIITYNVHFMKGGLYLCGQEVGLSSQKKMDLRALPQNLQRDWQNRSKEDKISLVIYVILSLIWNVLSLTLILIVARLNNTFIECIFILTSFWLSKRSFGRPFHLSSMAQCFAVSNLTYYVLNKVTTPIGISIVVPVLLGVGLSYVTSKLVKKIYKPLYRGMPVSIFKETILKVVDEDSQKYKICYEYYINKKSAISLSMTYSYSEAGIRKICSRVNDDIKRLN